MKLRSPVLLLALLSLVAAPATAQTTGQPAYLTTPDFARLVDGKSVMVLTRDGREYEGFFAVSDNALVLTRVNSVTAIPFDQIARVQKSTFRMRHHSLIGLGVGAVIGAALGAKVCEGTSCPPEVFSFMSIFGGIGAGIGAGVGASLNKSNFWKDMIYDEGTRPRTVAIAPLVTASRRGVAVVMTWR